MLYTHIAQLMTHATNVYKAAAYLAVILISLLTYCSESKSAYIIRTQQKANVDIFPLKKIVETCFQTFQIFI